MIIAAKKASQVSTHMAIAFGLMYLMTGSAAFGGLAAVAEPVVNVALLPWHEKLWRWLQSGFAAGRARYLALAGEKLSQTAMHAAVAFGMMYWATGSAAFGGMAALLEPIVNVIALPYHDRLWDRLQVRGAGLAAA